jgi:hypothetical protein
VYSDYEVECMYLGRPFEERTNQGKDLRDRENPLHSADEQRYPPAHPPVSLLVATAR